MESQRTQNSQHNANKEEQSQRTDITQLQGLSYIATIINTTWY